MEGLVEDPLPDALDDPCLADDSFFKNATCCILIKDRRCILRVRDQMKTNGCYAFVVTATMYAEEVLRRGCSTQGSTQEFLDYMHRFQRPKTLKNPTGPYDVPDKGFVSSFADAFSYVMKYGLSPETLYPWAGKTTFKKVEDDTWDGTVIYGKREKDLMGCEAVVDKRIIQREEKISLENYERICGLELVESYLEKQQPITGRVKISEIFWEWRGQGIYKGSDADEIIGNHAVTIIGYGSEGNDAYYICQNSFGRKWGYKGYYKVKRELVQRFYIPKGTTSPGNKKNVSILSSKRKPEAEPAPADEAETMGCHAPFKRHNTSS